MKKENLLKNNKEELLEGSMAIARTVKNIEPSVISAYPITPQTHIVEELAKFKANEKTSYEYLLAESEFAAASIVLGASAAGSRAYSATSSQGLLLMAEVLFNISGLRLPVVMTIANRAVGAPINIWNDHSDAMAVRDAGWIMLFASDHQETVNQHVLAFKIAESLRLPVMVNVDGFIITHSYDSVIIPNKKEIKQFLPKYKPALGTYLNPKKPITIGSFFTPDTFWQERATIQKDLSYAKKTINSAFYKWQNIFKTEISPLSKFNNGLLEYIGTKNAKVVIVAMGSMCTTIEEIIKTEKDTALLKIKTYRPFPYEEINDLLKNKNQIFVLEKAISPGSQGGPLFLDIASSFKKEKPELSNYIVGLGGKDVSEKMILEIINKKTKDIINFL